MEIYLNSFEISMKCQFKFQRNTNGISIKYLSNSIGNPVKMQLEIKLEIGNRILEIQIEITIKYQLKSSCHLNKYLLKFQ